MPATIEAPCVWHGEELFSRADWLHQVDATHLEQIQCLMEGNGKPTPELARLFSNIRHSLENHSGATLIRGLPVETLDEDCAKTLLLKLASQIGSPVSQSSAGDLVFSVRDAGYKESDPRSRGPNTRRKLTFHSDRCDVIGFLCLRQAKSGGGNDLVSSAAIHNRLLQTRPELLEELYRPFYYKRHNVDTGNRLPYCRQPVFSSTQGKFACNLLRILIDRAYAMPELPDMTNTQREALDAIESLAAQPGMHAGIRQQPGDMLLMNNWVTLHRRSEFEDYCEPERKRHILRVWISPPNNRPIDPLFRDNYGAVDAGSIRGGMAQGIG
ncbi:MAG: TauD/TfdA family dioxygenase [Verrucomicrobiales bacterium]